MTPVAAPRTGPTETPTSVGLEPPLPGADVTPSQTPTPTADQDWRALDLALGGIWEQDWPLVIQMLDVYLQRYPRHPDASNKLYSALVSYGQALVRDGRRRDAVPLFVRATNEQLVEDPAVARIALLQLTPTSTPTPRPPTSTPTRVPTPTPLPPLRVTMLAPSDGARVGSSLVVSGMVNRPLPAGQHIWVIVRAVDQNGPWYSQHRGEVIPEGSNRWATDLYLGGPRGTRHEVRVGTVSDAAHQSLTNYIRANPNRPLSGFPSGFQEWGRAIVTLQ